MTPESPIKLVSQVLDLPLLDSEGKYCGIVDDVELRGRPGQDIELKALMVGPGAYEGRLPRWMMWIVKRLAGDRVTRVSMDDVQSISSVVHLKRTGRELGLHKSEEDARRWLPNKGAL
jgi:hypothetical protein